MNLLLINYEYPPIGGGAANATKYLAQALVQLGHEVHVLTSSWQEEKGILHDGAVVLHRLSTPRARADRCSLREMLSFILRAKKAAPALAQREAIDAAIVFFTFPCGPIGLDLQKRLQIPYLVFERGGDVPGLVPELNWLHCLLTPYRRKILNKAMAVAANGHGLASLSRRADPDIPVRVINNGVDIDTFRPAEDKISALQMLFVGRFTNQKNLPFLFKIFARCFSTHPELRLVMVGDGPDKKQLCELAQSMNISKHIHWKGWLDKTELLAVYQQSTLFLSPSRYEGVPNTVMEAMACAIPVIISNIPGHDTLVPDENHGFLMKDFIVEDYVQRCMDLLGDPAARHAVGMRAREYMKTNFSWQSTARQCLELMAKAGKS